MSLYDNINKEYHQRMMKIVSSTSTKVTEMLNGEIYNFLQFAKTNDKSYLVKAWKQMKDKESDNLLKENIEPNYQEIPSQISIKKEKLSIAPSGSSLKSVLSGTSTSVNKNVTTNSNFSEMPAPSKPLLRKNKIKTEPVEELTRETISSYEKQHKEKIKPKPSDVIIQNTTITMIDITEDSECTDEEKSVRKMPGRTTRTKTRQSAKEVNETKQKNKLTPTKLVISNEDAACNNNLNATHIVSKGKHFEQLKNDTPPTRSTRTKTRLQKKAEGEQIETKSNIEDTTGPTKKENVSVVEDSNVKKLPQKVRRSELSFERDEQEWKTPPKTNSKKQQIKEIFSPYHKSSTKKKVEAFEKLGSASKASSKLPIRMEGSTPQNPGSATQSKRITPFFNKFMPKSCSTVKVNKTIWDNEKRSLYSDNGISQKSLSALKASQAEYREREKRRLEKEKDAQLKKEALLVAHMEEKRRKREERQLKVQQQREINQKEKEKELLLLQKLKDEKYKESVAEKEELLQKAKEEKDKKRLLAKKKAAKEKEERELAKETAEKIPNRCIQQQNGMKGESERRVPVYMVTKAPYLPTDDCYDSDEEPVNPTRRRENPAWMTGSTLSKQLYAQLVVGDKIKNTLFCSLNTNPDLVDILENVDCRKLKRTSSAVWKKPPTYTLFSETKEIHFSEDSDD